MNSHHAQLKRYSISPPLQNAMQNQQSAAPQPIRVIISLKPSREKPELGVQVSRDAVRKWLEDRNHRVEATDFYVFASMYPDDIRALAQEKQWVDQIWKDETCYAHVLHSADTVKATACWRTFDARGRGVAWAVMDTGIRSGHPHFAGVLDASLSRNFSADPDLEDANGHGTHVAGIIGGCSKPREDGTAHRAATAVDGQDDPEVIDLNGCPSGMAPLAKLINVKVLDRSATGDASAAIRGLEYLRKLNQNNRSIVVDGVNMSLGYPFDPKWYGCGHSPLCEEVTRAVNSGINVVISCGNSGYGTTKLDTGEEVPAWMDLSITDPANTEEAIAVGSVHKSSPHTFGVSYFSSKGPTGDGRIKPDLVAPGEKIISCSICTDKGYAFEERSGTSMAAPHVSGVIAAFLSAHPEYRGNPRAVKDILIRTATDLGRAKAFQGAGLVDLMRAIMSV